MKLASLFSGGKDSNYSLYLASKEHEIKCLISMISKNKESYMFQTPGNSFLKLQAESLEIPIIEYQTDGEKEKELEDLKNAIKKAIKLYNIEGIITGAIKSTYQSSRIQKICNELDIYCINPLWQIDEEEYLGELIKNKFKIIILSIASYPFTKEYIGKIIDNDLIKKLKESKKNYSTSLIGEGGEFESFVIDSPLFKKEIQITNSNITCDSENSCILNIKHIKLIPKTTTK